MRLGALTDTCARGLRGGSRRNHLTVMGLQPGGLKDDQNEILDICRPDNRPKNFEDRSNVQTKTPEAIDS